MEFERVTLPEQHYVYLERDCDMADIAEEMGQAFREIFDFIARHGIEPKSAPLTVYTRMPSGNRMSFNCGVLVSDFDVGEAEDLVKGGTLPRGDAMKTVHVGPYSELNRAHKALWDHMAANDIDAAMPVWELYLDDPEKTDSDKLRTEIYRHIA